ncbi:MAG: zinc ribbon domain-containing protein [Ruthenibacterium sp.]
MTTFDKIKQSASVLADTAVKTGADFIHRGKQQVNLLALDSNLSKTQRQLGALVYSLRKSGETNEALIERYVAAIAAVETEIAAVRAMPAAAVTGSVATVLCPSCGAEVDPNAIFCPGCGNKLA